MIHDDMRNNELSIILLPAAGLKTNFPCVTSCLKPELNAAFLLTHAHSATHAHMEKKDGGTYRPVMAALQL